MTPEERERRALALEAAVAQMVQDHERAGVTAREQLGNACSVFHAAMTEGQVVLSVEDASNAQHIIETLADYERENGTLSTILDVEREKVCEIISTLALIHAFRELSARLRAALPEGE